MVSLSHRKLVILFHQIASVEVTYTQSVKFVNGFPVQFQMHIKSECQSVVGIESVFRVHYFPCLKIVN